jgi:hypothetical protein
LVLMTYVVFGPAYRLKLDAGSPLVSAERVVVWLGVKALHLLMLTVTIVWDLLSDASAEVGDWFVRRSSQEVQAAYRARFL